MVVVPTTAKQSRVEPGAKYYRDFSFNNTGLIDGNIM